MITNLKPYPALRDSGVESLGEVPEHWAIHRIKNWVRINQIALPETTDPNFSFYYIDIGSVGKGRLTAKPKNMRFYQSPTRARRVVRRGDTIVSMVRTYLKAVWHSENPAHDLGAAPLRRLLCS